MSDVTAIYGNLIDFFFAFFKDIFICIIIDNHSCLNFCIFTKLSQIMCLINKHIWYINMPDATASYGRSFDYIVFIDEYSCLKYCIITKLSQIECLINVHILVCQHVKYDSRLWKIQLRFCVFSYIIDDH